MQLHALLSPPQGKERVHRTRLYNEGMPRTLGYHLVKSCYGLWLPGDARGHWSDAWDEQIGFIEPHQLHPGDPVRLRMAQERMTHPPVKLTAAMTAAVVRGIGACVAKSNFGLLVAAAAIDHTHFHLLLPYTGRDIDRTAAWIADQTTKEVHSATAHVGPIWGKSSWKVFVFTHEHWDAARCYIERHNVRNRLDARPYEWITEY